MTYARKRSIITIIAIALLAAGIWMATLASAAPSVSKFTLKEKANSGVTGSGTYSNSRVNAKASGLNPSKRYYSFVYGAGSDADGANPCILTGELLLPNQVNVGQWKVDSDGNGTLSAKAPVPVNSAGTLSIREDPLNSGGVVPLQPVTYPLVACANIGSNQNTPLGNVQNQLPNLTTPNINNPTNGLLDNQNATNLQQRLNGTQNNG